MVADAVFVHVAPVHVPARYGFGHAEGLQNRARVRFAAAEIVDFRDPRRFPELVHEGCDVFGVDVIPHLLAFVAEDLVLAAFEAAADQIAQEPMQFHAGVIRAGQASAAQAAGRHAEVAAVFLNHDVARDLRRAEDGMLALIDGEIFRDTVFIGRVGIVPARFQFGQSQRIGTVAIHFVGRHMNEGRFGTGAARRFEEVKRSKRIHFEIEKGNGGGPVVRRLGGGVNDEGRLQFGDQVQNGVAVPNVQRFVAVTRNFGLELAEHPTGVALGSEEDCPVIAVDSRDGESEPREPARHFRADQSAGTCHQACLFSVHNPPGKFVRRQDRPFALSI
jgi:hypothetical protein